MFEGCEVHGRGRRRGRFSVDVAPSRAFAQIRINKKNHDGGEKFAQRHEGDQEGGGCGAPGGGEKFRDEGVHLGGRDAELSGGRE